MAIAGYLGTRDTFDDAMASLAETYSDQNDAGTALRPAVDTGRIAADTGLEPAQMTPSGSDPATAPGHAGAAREPAVDRRLETPRAAGVAGLAFAVLFVASILLMRSHPAGESTATEIRNFYVHADAGRVALVGVHLAPFAGIAFLWFIAVVRNLIGDREDRFFATVFLGSGLLFVAMLFAAAGASGALLVAVKFQGEPVPSPETVVTVRSLAFAFLFVYAMRMAAVFTIVVSTIGMRLGVFPRWVAIAGYLVALVLLVNVSYSPLLVLVFPAWVAAVSVVILKAATRPARANGSLLRPDP